MLILGIDPGTAITGYGLLEAQGNKLKAVDYACVRTPANMPLEHRLLAIHGAVEDLIKQYKPTHLAVEELFFNKNVRTALSVGHARGVIILAGVSAGLEVFEYTPLQVKQSVVGYGRADKAQVQFMVKTILNLPEIPKPDDVADALAIAICHTHFFNSKKMFAARENK
jgi:crossover junction endodeoxyribonuclease RuvC